MVIARQAADTAFVVVISSSSGKVFDQAPAR
jgi:hypothetical protein